MLWFVGIGVNGYKGLSIQALEVLKSCDTIYVERFTSAISDDDIHDLNSLIKKNCNDDDNNNNDNDNVIRVVDRWFVEDGRAILDESKSKDIMLLTYGDPLVATTLTELYVRAVKGSTKVSIIHNASGITSLIGETGLHVYKFGRTVTMMSDYQSAISVYNVLFDNLLVGSHTLVLTEYNSDHNKLFYLDPRNVFQALSKVEEDLKYRAFLDETFVIIASRIGTDQQKIISGKVKSLINRDFGTGPHSIIITGSLHFTESDALTTLTHNVDNPYNNPSNIQKLAVCMVEKYAPRAKYTLAQMRSTMRSEDNTIKQWIPILNNAESYIEDAERFLKQGKPDLAVLSIGYAEGLIDALRFQKDDCL
jgi:diphthine synthase